MRKKFFTGVTTLTILASTIPVLAKVESTSIPVNYNNITVNIDGDLLSTSNEPFIYNGVTYLPVRDVAEATGMFVDWDSSTKTVNLTSSTSSTTSSTSNSSTAENSTITLSGGNYIAGTDFPAGKYNIVCISGVGLVRSSNSRDGGISEILASESKKESSSIWSDYDSEFKNCNLPNGTTLELPSGVKITLTKVN